MSFVDVDENEAIIGGSKQADLAIPDMLKQSRSKEQWKSFQPGELKEGQTIMEPVRHSS